MTSKIKRSAIFLLATIVLSNAQAYYCVQSETGWEPIDTPIKPNDDTIATERQQAARTWQDFIWRGSSQGESFLCPPNTPKGCVYTWGKSKSVATAWSAGLSIDPKGMLPNKYVPELSAKFAGQWQRTVTTMQTFGYNVNIDAGMRVEPVIIQDRRWRSGDFVNGDVKVSQSEGFAKNEFYSNVHKGWGKWYQWTVCFNPSNKVYGYWADNKAEGLPYKSYNVWKPS